MPALDAGRARSARPDAAQVLSLTVWAAAIAMSAALGAGCGSDDSKPGSQCSTSGHPEDFLPGTVQGLEEMAGERQTAATIPELQATIVDGGFQPYELYGFQEFARTAYQGTVGSSLATLEVYVTEFPSATQAMAMYNDTQYGIKPAISEPVNPPIGDASRLARSFGSLTIDFVICSYWTKLFINDTSNDALSVLQAFATSIEQEIAP